MFQILLIIIYLSFISLGLPDSLLGSAWPMMYREFSVPVSYVGIISMIIAIGTVVSSLQSDKLTKRFGTGVITAYSVAMTAIALFGFSISRSYLELCLWAIPYGLGAGSVDASLNNYVALHFANKHMNWLHCMWGVGASLGPYIMGYTLSSGNSWNKGYLYISIIQFIITSVLLFSLPLWKTKKNDKEKEERIQKPLSLKEIINIAGVKEIMITFFCYCAIEQTTGLWASTYLVLHENIANDIAASYASLFFIGITIGRLVSGFISIKLDDNKMIRLGQILVLIGIILIVLPLSSIVSLLGLIIIGLGCAPIYPSIIHSTPNNFGEDKSQAVIGVQMASAYVGTALMPPLFGLIANNINIALLPLFLLISLILMTVMHKRMLEKSKALI